MSKKLTRKIGIVELRKEAMKFIKKGDFAFRSCWDCNPAHEHLKEARTPIKCFSCDNWYYKGKNLMKR